MEELIERVKRYEKTKTIWRSKFDSREFREASQLNKELFGIPLNRKLKCQCIEDLFFYIKNSKKVNQLTIQKMNKFKIKTDKAGNSKQIQLHGHPEVLTNGNLTDAKAIALLKKCPAHIKSFETYPENWMDLIANSETAKDAIVDDGSGKVELTAEEIAAKAREEKINTRRDELKAKTLDELKAICKEQSYPEADYKKFKAPGLINYILQQEFTEI